MVRTGLKQLDAAQPKVCGCGVITACLSTLLTGANTDVACAFQCVYSHPSDFSVSLFPSFWSSAGCSAEAALDRFAMKRFYDSKCVGVTQPSQRKYVHYFSDLLAGKISLKTPYVQLIYSHTCTHTCTCTCACVHTHTCKCIHVHVH